MKINVQEVNAYSREIWVEVPWDELKDDFNTHIKHFGKKIKMPGFRPGKVPAKVLMKQFLPAIEVDFTEHVLNKFYLQSLKDTQLEPVNKAEVDKVNFTYENELSFIAKFEIEPEITLPKLSKRSFKIQKTHYIHEQEEVDLVIEDIRRRNSSMETIEEGAEEGHIILADIQKLDENRVPIIGSKLEKQYFKVGGGVIKGENLEKLIGAKADDKIQLYLTENEQGEKSLYEITVINVEKEVLPDLNDEFIKTVDPEASNETEFIANVETRIKENYEHQSKEAFERQLSDAMIEKVNPDCPPSMVESYLSYMVDELKKSGEPGAKDLDEEKAREMYQPIAERNLKWFLVRKAIIGENELVVSKAEVELEIQRLLNRSPDHKKEIEKYYKKPSNRRRIEDDLMEKNILDHIQQFAKIKEVKVKTKDLRKQEEHKHGV